MEGVIQRVVIIGSGNVATHLAAAIQRSGCEILQIYSRTLHKAEALGKRIGCDYTNRMEELPGEADLYLMAVSDDAIMQIADSFPYKNKFLVHTSGSTSVDSLESAGNRTGVFYPLQTFSAKVDLDLSHVPLCLEASDEHDLTRLEKLASGISDKVYRITSHERLILHVAAVFVCNFTNHMFTLGSDIMQWRGLSFEMLRPLISETARKAMIANPEDIQTGPAVRLDKKTIQAHMEILEGLPHLKNLYNFITQSLINRHKPENNENH